MKSYYNIVIIILEIVKSILEWHWKRLEAKKNKVKNFQESEGK